VSGIDRRGKATVIRSRRRDRAAVARNAAKVVNRSRIVRQSSEVTYAYTRYARQRTAIRMARRPADARICRNERVVRSHIYEPISILTHGSLDLIDDRRTAFSAALVGNQIAESGVG
jgi:hypothetical protein